MHPLRHCRLSSSGRLAVVAVTRRCRVQGVNKAAARASSPLCLVASSKRALSSSSSSASSPSSINEEELSKFNAYGTGWWSDTAGKTGAGPLHALNPVRVRYIAQCCGVGKTRKDLRGLSVLDVGCGGGLLSEALARLGASVTGIDPASRNIDIARAHASIDPLSQGITYECATAEELLQGTNVRFDAVVASEVIEHVEAPALFMQSLADLAGAAAADEQEGVVTVEQQRRRRRQGHVILTTINRTAKAYLLAIVAAERVLRMVPAGTHDWVKFLQPQELARFGRSAGLHLEDVSGMVYNPVKGTWHLDSDDTDVNYIVHFTKGEKSQ